MANTSVLGEKFVFSHYLEPVSEDVREKELENIDAWLEANESCNKEEVETPSADDQDAAADNTSSDSEACKESVEERIARLQAQLEDVSGELKDLLNEKSNFDKFVSNRNAKADENDKKAEQMKKIADDNPGSKAGEIANKKAQEYKNAAKDARHPEQFGSGQWHSTSTKDMQEIKDKGKAGINADSYSKDRHYARDNYKDAAANNGRKVATKTLDRKPGTYATKK